jgi:two-component system repressor protein LuxO
VGSNKVEKVDVRFISATNREPMEAIAQGRLREDLYYRLNVIAINMPRLKERENDASQLANFFINHFSELENKVFVGLSSGAEKFVNHYDWPGNVRQLENIIHSAIVMSEGPLITEQNLGRQLQLSDVQVYELVNKKSPVPSRVSYSVEQHAESSPVSAQAATDIRPLAEVERVVIEQAIALCQDNVTKAAGLLEVSPSTLYRKIQAWQS